MIERSWAEQRGYLDQAVACLDKDKQAEAKEAFSRLEPARRRCTIPFSSKFTNEP